MGDDNWKQKLKKYRMPIPIAQMTRRKMSRLLLLLLLFHLRVTVSCRRWLHHPDFLGRRAASRRPGLPRPIVFGRASSSASSSASFIVIVIVSEKFSLGVRHGPAFEYIFARLWQLFKIRILQRLVKDGIFYIKFAYWKNFQR